jgi:hypothetical protein
VYAADCAECETKEGMLDRIERDIRFAGPFTREQRSRLLELADKWPEEGHVVESSTRFCRYEPLQDFVGN